MLKKLFKIVANKRNPAQKKQKQLSFTSNQLLVGVSWPSCAQDVVLLVKISEQSGSVFAQGVGGGVDKDQTWMASNF